MPLRTSPRVCPSRTRHDIDGRVERADVHFGRRRSLFRARRRPHHGELRHDELAPRRLRARHHGEHLEPVVAARCADLDALRRAHVRIEIHVVRRPVVRDPKLRDAVILGEEIFFVGRLVEAHGDHEMVDVRIGRDAKRDPRADEIARLAVPRRRRSMIGEVRRAIVRVVDARRDRDLRVRCPEQIDLRKRCVRGGDRRAGRRARCRHARIRCLRSTARCDEAKANDVSHRSTILLHAMVTDPGARVVHIAPKLNG